MTFDRGTEMGVSFATSGWEQAPYPRAMILCHERVWPRHLQLTCLPFLQPLPFHNMNSLTERFATTGYAAELKRAKDILGEDEDGMDLMWGSQAGFGNLAGGVPKFNIPAVPDVCFNRFVHIAAAQNMFPAYCVPQDAYGRLRGSFLQDQNQARYHHARFPIPGWCHCGC